MVRNFLVALFASAAIALAGCGGSSNDSSSSSSDNGGDMAFQGVSGPLDPVQSGFADVVGDQVGGALPEPLGPGVKCVEDAANFLVDGPDALIAALAGLPSGADPQVAFEQAAAQLQMSLEAFAAQLQAALITLAGDNPDCDVNMAGNGDGSGNPLAGTPLEPLGAALVQLQDALADLPDAGGDGGGDPNLAPLLADTVAPALEQLSVALGQVPAETQDVPVLGGLFTTLQTATADLADVLEAAGPYDGPATAAELEVFLNNLLSNLFLQVIPIAEFDTATGQDFSSQIQSGIDQITAALVGDGLSQVINPLFGDVLDGAAEPLLQPLEDALATILAGGAGSGGGPTGTPLDQLITLLTGGDPGNPLDSVLDPILDGLSGLGLPL